jgi:hypothetical protein
LPFTHTWQASQCQVSAEKHRLHVQQFLYLSYRIHFFLPKLKWIAIFDGSLYQMERGRNPLIATRSGPREDLSDALKVDSVVWMREVR